MIKLEHVVLASPEQMKFIIEGMRNPLESWRYSDSFICPSDSAGVNNCINCRYALENDVCEMDPDGCNDDDIFVLGKNDHKLMMNLAKAGKDHAKYLRMMPVYVRITAPLYWWKEFETYKVGTVSNSCSTMHRIQAKEFTLEDFSTEHLLSAKDPKLSCVPELKPWMKPMEQLIEDIKCLNYYRDIFNETREKIYWLQMIQRLPSSYNQTRNVSMNYEVLANIYHSRKGHKLDEWRKLCKWVETLPYSELITGKGETDGSICA